MTPPHSTQRGYGFAVASIAHRVLAALVSEGSLDDDELADRFEVRRQSINQVTRRLATEGRIRRYLGPDGKLTNALPSDEHIAESAATQPPLGSPDNDEPLAEDEVKTAVQDHLDALGYTVTVAWGRARGIDIEATHLTKPRQVIEAKGEVSSDQQQGNYFLGALGELLQRMSDPDATYALALPDNRRYRGLVRRLPDLARDRLSLRVYWVKRVNGRLEVEVDNG